MEPLRDSLSPDLCLAEVSNAIVEAARRGEISQSDARAKFMALLKLSEGNLRLVRNGELFQHALAIALGEARLSVYDGLFIALAKKMFLPLYTRDKLQHEAALQQAVPSTLLL